MPPVANDVPVVSVVVPAWNAAVTIGATLESLLNQDCCELEIVVISDGSRDATMKVVKQFNAPCIRVVERHANQGLAATLMEGLRHTQGPIVMFLHADCQLASPSWISQAVRHFQDPQVAWVTGFYETLKPESTNLVHQAFAVLRGEMLRCYLDQNLEVRPIRFSEGKCDLLRREVISSIGGIPSILRRSGEDQLLSHAVRQKGWTILKDGSLVVQQHYSEANPLLLVLGNLKKEFLHGKTQAVINLKHWRTILRDLRDPFFAARKGSHPALKATAFAVTLGALLYAVIARDPIGFAPLLLLWSVLAAYYVWKCHYSGVRLLSPLTFLVIALGLASA